MSGLELPALSASPLTVKRTLSNSALESETQRDRGQNNVRREVKRYSSMTTRRSFISRQRHHTWAHWSVVWLLIPSLGRAFFLKKNKKIFA